MFRKMQKLDNPDQVITVTEWIALQNLWEIYVFDTIEQENGDKEYLTLTLGQHIEPEMGSQWESEIRPNIMTRSTNLHDLLPAPGWKWVGEDA